MSPLDEQQHDHFLRLFTEHESALRAFVRRLVPARADAADVMQEVALVLWRKFGQCSDTAEFRKWAFTVARFEALAWLRDRARDRIVLGEDVLEMLAEESAHSEPRLAAQREALEGCLRRLGEDERMIVIAAYAPGARVQDVARRTGRSVTAFYQWLHRVRVALLNCTRRPLAKEGFA